MCRIGGYVAAPNTGRRIYAHWPTYPGSRVTGRSGTPSAGRCDRRRSAGPGSFRSEDLAANLRIERPDNKATAYWSRVAAPESASAVRLQIATHRLIVRSLGRGLLTI